MNNKIVKLLKQLEADSHIMYVKLHNFHWNVKGMDFFPVHNETENMYNYFSELYDETAERVLQLNDIPFLTSSELRKNSAIKEIDKSKFNSKEVITYIIKDYEYFIKQFKKLAELSDKKDDRITAGICDKHLEYFEKQIWFMNNMVKAG